MAGPSGDCPLDLSSAAGPAATLAADRRTGIAVGVTFAVVFGTLFGGATAKAGEVFDPVTGIIGAIVIWVAFNFAVTAWLSFATARIWLALNHRLPWQFMSFLADAHLRGVLRQTGAVYQFRHIELQHRLANTSGSIGSYYDLGDMNGDGYRVTLVKILDPARGAGQDTNPDSGKRFIGAVFRITALRGSPNGTDANSDVTVIDSDGQAYSADLKTIVGYANFDNRTIHVAQGSTSTGSVTFQIPEGVEVVKVQWNPGGLGSTVQWQVRR